MVALEQQAPSDTRGADHADLLVHRGALGHQQDLAARPAGSRVRLARRSTSRRRLC